MLNCNRTSATKLESASRDMESRKAKENEFLRQLERDNALLQHKQQDVKRKAEQESEKRKKVMKPNVFAFLLVLNCLCLCRDFK